MKKSMVKNNTKWRENQFDKRFKNTILDFSIMGDKKKEAYIVDGVMGYGKTSAAINFINDQPRNVRIIYITPYLDEVERIIKSCPEKKFIQPNTKNAHGRKKDSFLKFIKEGRNIVCTHALFKQLNEDHLDYIKLNNYILIMDEVADVIEDSGINQQDIRLLLGMTRKGDIVQNDEPVVRINKETGIVEWIDESYTGELAEQYKSIIDLGCLMAYGAQKGLKADDNDVDLEAMEYTGDEEDNTDSESRECPAMLIWNYPIAIYEKFYKIFVLTYMFEGQIQCGYYKFHNMPYRYIHVQREEVKVNGEKYIDFNFIPELFDEPQTFDLSFYQNLIHIEEGYKFNVIGEPGITTKNKKKRPLSKNWYIKNPTLLDGLKKKTYNYFKYASRNEVDNKYKMWTTFSMFKDKVKGDGYTKGFVSLNARATNKYKDKYILAYLVDRYPLTPIIKFLQKNNVMIDIDQFALSEMLQWIFRSRIRDGEEIWIYVPSLRMRNLLKVWMGLEPESEW